MIPKNMPPTDDPVRRRILEQAAKDATDPKFVAAVEEVAKEEAGDVDALLADLKRAQAALGDAYNRVVSATDPVLCVVQGRVETALETVDAAVDLVKGVRE